MKKPRVCSFESRRHQEMATLIAKMGGEPFVAPSMREVAIEDNVEAIAFGGALLAGDVDVLVFLTGVGATALVDAIATAHDRGAVLDALRQTDVCVRGPKPAAVLSKWGVPFRVRAPEPNTWVELVAAIDDSDLSLQGRSVVVQEYGQPSPELAGALEERGARVGAVAVYKWEMPEDTSLLEEAVCGIADGRFDVVAVTSAQQIRNALTVAERLGVLDAFRAGLASTKVASIGPTATATLEGLEIRVDVEPEHPKMGPLVRAALA